MNTGQPEINWPTLSSADVIQHLGSHPLAGLSQDEVRRRQELYGLNVLTKKKGKNAFVRFLLQFHQPLIYILLFSSIVTLLLKEYVDSSVIFGVILINAIVGFLQESKAITSLESLAKTMIAQATVLRDGEKRKLPSSELVPGDTVLVSSGDKVPADIRLIESKELQVNESAFSGESVPVAKKTDTVVATAPLAERHNMLYASTLVTYGVGKGIVVETGDRTEVGKISALIAGAEDLETPLTKKIARFSKFLLYVILGLAAVTFLIGILRGESLIEMFMAAVALAVGMIPEGLPAAITVTLAIGVSRLAERKAIIRKLPTVETLGSTTVICSDKTGTLTENQMTVQEMFAGDEHYVLTGVGYSIAGEILHYGHKVDFRVSIALEECLKAGLACNDSKIVDTAQRSEVIGDPTEGALIVAALKGGITNSLLEQQLPRIDAIPFESQHQFMATLHADQKANRKIVYLKGATEKILERSTHYLTKAGEQMPLSREHIVQLTNDLASKGLRVLGFAYKILPVDTKTLSDALIQSDMVFLGIQGMIDPPRPEALRALQKCYTAGIEVKMITGDHVLTASTIARQLGLRCTLPGTDNVCAAVTGTLLAEYSDDELNNIVEKSVVFARTSPEQKFRLVKSLQAKGHIVAMTGDGVNDAPSLKQANIGIAMGMTGTEVAKDAADLVLTDDNFATIEAAIEEGRGVFDNLMKFIVWTLPTNLGEGLSLMVAIFAGIALPVLPQHLLWINMTTAVLLGMMLAFEPKESGIMNRPPIDPRLPIMRKDVVQKILFVGSLLALGVFGLYEFELRQGATVTQARSVAASVLVIGELFFLFNCRSLTKSVFSVGVFSNPWVIFGAVVMAVVQWLFVHLPVMNRFFETAAISFESWVRVYLFGFALFLLVGLEKYLRQPR